MLTAVKPPSGATRSTAEIGRTPPVEAERPVRLGLARCLPDGPFRKLDCAARACLSNFFEQFYL